MRLAVHLLGTPRVEVLGVPSPPPRGRKVWALLAYLILADRPVPRQRLASLLFPDADDPSGALRWNLAQLRRLLGLTGALTGSALELELPPDALVDVTVLRSGTWLEALELPGLGHELLEGVEPRASWAFEAWLLAERRHVQQQTEALLHEAALAELAAGDGAAAVRHAATLVGLNALDENHQELLIRALAASGDRAGASRQLAACVELYRRELGVEPGPGVFAAAEATGATATATAAGGRAAARALLEAGEAAISAGAVDAGLECLRRSAAEAHACGDLSLKAAALLGLGRALAHAARGRDEEAAAALHEAVVLGERLGRVDVTASARRELAYIDALRARYERALAQIDAAEAAAGGPDWFTVLGRAACAWQTGSSTGGLRLLREALELAGDDPRHRAWVLGEIGTVHVVRGELEEARAALSASLELSRRTAWNAYVPYPEAMLGIVEVSGGEVATASERLEHAFALGCQLRDCCWEGMAEAGLALLEEARGNVRAAVDRIEDAARRSAREPDAWLWGHAFVLDLRCGLGLRRGLERAPAWVADLETLAARSGMRGMLARAYAYRAVLEPAALEMAELLAAEVDDPGAVERLASARAVR